MKKLSLLTVFLLLGAAAGPKRAPDAVKDDTETDTDTTKGSEGEDPGAAALEAPGPDAARRPQSLTAEAERIVSIATETTYSHHTVIDEKAGSFDVDCSGFVGYLLRRAAPDARRELVAGTVKRPLARHFVSFISALPPPGAGHWKRVMRGVDLRAGDIIAWTRPADSKSTNTGHVMLVAASPRMRGPDVEVPIFDSTALRHGHHDQRAAGATSGVGQGAILLRLDRDGRPLAFRWSPTGRYHDHQTDIVLARVQP